MNFGADESWPHRQFLITHRLRQRRSDLGSTQKEVVVKLARLGLHTRAVNPPMTQSLILGDDIPDRVPAMSEEARSVRP